MVDFNKVMRLDKEREARRARGEYHTIIAGSRGLGGVYDLDLVTLAAKRSGFNIVRVLSGTAKGIDRAGEQWAALKSIEVDRYPADWDHEGKGAGYTRNVRMAYSADALVAVWDGASRGTTHMIETMRDHEKPVFVLQVTRWFATYRPTPTSVATCALVLQGDVILGCPEREYIGRDIDDWVEWGGGVLREAK